MIDDQILESMYHPTFSKDKYTSLFQQDTIAHHAYNGDEYKGA